MLGKYLKELADLDAAWVTLVNGFPDLAKDDKGLALDMLSREMDYTRGKIVAELAIERERMARK